MPAVYQMILTSMRKYGMAVIAVYQAAAKRPGWYLYELQGRKTVLLGVLG